MLLKVKYHSSKKYIKLHSGFTYLEFIREVKNKFGLPDTAQLNIFDETDTAVEDDILLELLEANPDICLTVRDSITDEDHSTPSSLTDTMSLSSSDRDPTELGIPTGRSRSSKEDTNSSATKGLMSEAAKEMVEKALLKKPGGEDILEEYKSENSLMHRTRRQLVNILASDITERHGRIPSRQQKEKYALGIITLFPSLKDPFSPKGYEHFYDGEKGTGYLAWRLKTISRTSGKRPVKEVSVHQAQGPKRRRSATTLPQQLDGDACREAISFLVHSPDEASVFQKMKMTFQHRQDLVHDPQRSTDVFKTFPRFLDVKGLVNQDFLLLFGAETASKMLEKWDTSFKPKVIKEAKKLTQTTELCRLLKAAEKLAENDETDWDSDIASMLLLLHLLPPTAGRKRTKISPSDAVDKMVHFHKSCCSINEYVQEREGKQPYILAVGRTRKTIDTFYIAVDKQLILCQATSSLGAFDELFKSHYVFNLSYDESLVHFYTFLQTTVFNIDVTTTDESPRVRGVLRYSSGKEKICQDLPAHDLTQRSLEEVMKDLKSEVTEGHQVNTETCVQYLNEVFNQNKFISQDHRIQKAHQVSITPPALTNSLLQEIVKNEGHLMQHQDHSHHTEIQMLSTLSPSFSPLSGSFDQGDWRDHSSFIRDGVQSAPQEISLDVHDNTAGQTDESNSQSVCFSLQNHNKQATNHLTMKHCLRESSNSNTVWK